MTSRERLMAIFRGDVPDRPAVKLWAAEPGQELLHPAYKPVRDAAIEKTDLMLYAASHFDLPWGAEKPPATSEERPTGSSEWVDRVTRIETPAGTLEGVYRASASKQPGYILEYLVKEPADLEKVLSSPYVPNPFNAASFFAKEKEVGERGLTMFGLPHAMYALQQFTGSENFAIWSIECREELLEVVGEYGRRILEHIKLALAAGIRGVYGWVGPEVCIPPLMSPRDFDDFILPFDKAICDLIHEGGGYNWVHCHGGMQPVIERFVEMGADVLNPVEPPPMGDVTLEEAFDMVGNRMGIEGNIENHEFWVSSPERVAEIVREALEAGRGRRLILCSCSGYMEDPEPPARFIENLLVYINEGLHHAERMAKG